MSDSTVYFRCGGTQFKIYLDKLPTIPLAKIKKLFRYMWSDTFRNWTAVSTVAMWLPVRVLYAEAQWEQASQRYQNEYRLPGDKRSKEGREIEAQNKKLLSEVKKAKATYHKWKRIQEIWNEVKGE